jgi:hypothetical protein
MPHANDSKAPLGALKSMPNEIGAPSQPVKTGDAHRSENVKGAGAVHELLKREAKAAQVAQSAAIVPPAAAPAVAEPIAQTAAPSQPDAQTSQLKPDQQVEAQAAAADPDEVLSKQLSPETQEAINRRIGKEAEKTRLARDEAARYKALFEAAPKQQQAPAELSTPDNPLGNVHDVAGLLEAQKNAKEAKRWAEAQLDRDDLSEGVRMGNQTLTKSDLKAIVRNAEVTLEDHIPQRNNFIQQRAQNEKVVTDNFPWMADRASAERQMYDAAWSDPANAFLHRLPNAPLLVAKQVLGEMAVRQMMAAKQTGFVQPARAAKPQAPNSQTGGSGASGPSRQASAGAKDALKGAMEELTAGKRGISGRDAVAFLAKTEKIRSAR